MKLAQQLKKKKNLKLGNQTEEVMRCGILSFIHTLLYSASLALQFVEDREGE